MEPEINNQAGTNTQNNIIEPTSLQIKQRTNYWIISTILLALLSLLLLGILLFVYSQSKNNSMSSNTVSENTQFQPTTNQQITDTPTASPTSSLKLTDFTNKSLLGENNNYSVYLINPKGESPEQTGNLLVIYNKNNQSITQIAGTFTIDGATEVIDDNMGKYLLLSTGTYSSRAIIPLSFDTTSQATNEFCSSSNFLFYNNYVIYGNCDTFQNRPWGVGEAPSLVALNLQTGLTTTIAKSDLTHQYSSTKITNDTLTYSETSVVKEADWQSQDTQNSTVKTFDLKTLNK